RSRAIAPRPHLWRPAGCRRLAPSSLDTTELWTAMDQMIREHTALADMGLVHHGGHAIGLRIHVHPDINRHGGGILEPDDVICLEPGGSVPEARHGVRIENTYLIHQTGAEIRSKGSIELLVCP